MSEALSSKRVTKLGHNSPFKSLRDYAGEPLVDARRPLAAQAAPRLALDNDEFAGTLKKAEDSGEHKFAHDLGTARTGPDLLSLGLLQRL